VDRLLILSCSQRKVGAADQVPAIDRYDGPAFRVLRKYLREGPPETPTVLILSAKYGLIGSDRRIPAYDCRMSAARARELRPHVIATARQVFASRRWQEVSVCVGKHYRSALDGFLPLLPDGCPVVFLSGGQGPRLTRLRAWLRRSGCVEGQSDSEERGHRAGR
jgi:hypothetical protein